MIEGRQNGAQTRPTAVSRNQQSLRPHRVAINVTALLTTSDAHTYPVIVRDISARGFRIEATNGEELLVGEVINLLVNGKEHYAGRVTWVAGSQAGAAFLNPNEVF